MPKKKVQQQLDIAPILFKGPRQLVQGIKSAIKDIQTTKVISTWVIESNNLKIKIIEQGKTLFSGIVKWIGNTTDGSPGVVMCVANGKDLKIIYPTPDTVKNAVIDVERAAIGFNVGSSLKCSVCGKDLTIFDERAKCPSCNAPAHKDHLYEWVKMRNSCPVCNKEIHIDPTTNEIVLG